jgi:predicted ATPase/DNA-binding winged helix-turn-helix (wHTH) protein
VPNRAAVSADQTISFGPFRLVPSQQLLLEDGKPVRLGSRALDILIALAERPNELVSKEELIARVWPDTFVEEGNLRVHIATLRRTLGDGQAGKRYVANIPGRGYRFVAPVSLSADQEPLAPLPSAATRTHDLPAPPTRMLGRDDIVNSLISQLPQRRFITLVGPGGIGKTTVALAAADRSTASYRDGVRFVDLASLTDPLLVPSALAFVLGLAIRSDNPIPGLVAFLRDKKMLLVLDSCDHVIDAAASLAEQVLNGAPGVHILTTSREALRAQGERVQRLGPLGVPAVSAGLTAAEAMTYPAVQLFVERATESLDTFELTDADARVVADICRRLDGIALAIELAAGRVDAFGVRGLAARLDDRFRLLTHGRRTALPRHQTLSATLDWSYEHLPESERWVLRRLAVFAGGFTLDAAQAITASTDIDAGEIADHVANLVAKSLITVDVGNAVVHYRLLETTRVYCLGKLKESGESELFARRHAEYFRDLFERAETEWETRPATEWLTAYGRQIDNVRTALDWAFSPGGDTGLGVALTIAAVPLWKLLSLMEECRSRAQRALDSLGPQARSGTRQAMKLLTALGAALRYDKTSGTEIETAWTNVLAIAEHLDDADYQLRAISGLRTIRLTDGNLREVLALARRFKEVAARATDRRDVLVGDRMIGFALYLLGEQADARRHIETMLRRYVTSVHRLHIIRFGYDQRVIGHNTLASILWLQGFPDQAVRIAERNIEDALSLDHELSLCNALGQCACRIALLVGDLAAAERYVAMLLDHSARHSLPAWHASGRCFDGILRIKQGDVGGGLNALRTGLDELSETRFETRYLAFLAQLAEASSRVGEIASGRAAIDEALEQCHRNEELWYLPELLRLKGEILLREGASDAGTAAEAQFLQSLDWARRQQVLSWELRTATSLAKLWRSQGRLGDARDQLAPVYGRFTEGFETTDLRTAKQLLDELAHGASRRD